MYFKMRTLKKGVAFLFSEKTTICLNVSVPWVTWIPEASSLSSFRRITLLVLLIGAQCLQVEWCQTIILMQQVYTGVRFLPQFIDSWESM